MTTIELEGLRVRLEDPVQIDEGVGHVWFPQLSKFTTGELLAGTSSVGDDQSLPIHAQRLYTSVDGGARWEHIYTVTEARGSVKIPRPNGDLLVVPGDVRPDPPGQWRTFSGPYILFQSGGRRLVVEAGGVRFEGMPRDIAPRVEERVFPGTVNRGVFHPEGDGFDVDGRLLATAWLHFQGDELNSTVVLESEDEGRTWRYLSTVAGPEAVPDAPEGPDEPSMVRLETGELMCVMRVGSGPEWNLARAYGSDGGRSWSPADRLPAFSVKPCLRRLANGVLLISTGRPGIDLWLSTDPRGESWQSIDLVAHHNEWAPDTGYTIVPERSGDRRLRHDRDQTTAYTRMVEIEPNRVLLIHDRVPFGWNPVPRESDQRARVFVRPITVERV